MIAILDGYVDEPSCLGVPPYISPYPRYIAGMLEDLRIPYFYTTIDYFRKNDKVNKILDKADLVIVIAGIAVPGKYIGGRPLSLKELETFLPEKEKILVGPITLEIDEIEGYEIISFPFEHKLYQRLGGKVKDFSRNFVNKFAVIGAKVVKYHPDYPYLICEIETYKGCYWGRCSFCIERIHKISMRDPKWVLEEIEALYKVGIRYFRLGNQTDFFTYMGDYSKDIPKPNPEFIKAFHEEIWKRCPKIRTLHLDNVNPKTIAEYPEESKKIIKIIICYQTPGNVAAFGMESADERVIKKNSLISYPEDVMFAIQLMNKYGKYVGYNGMPYLLPGLNFVIGLKGETKETFEKNYEFLKEVYERGFLLRRINIRQVKVFPNTPMAEIGDRKVKKHKKYFRIFKEKVRREIDNPMLKKILPVGRAIKDLRCEYKKGRVTFARQLATYPILVGVLGEFERNRILDGRVIDYGMRSVTAFPILNINEVKLYQLEKIPGIGKNRAAKIIASKPYLNEEDAKEKLDEIFDIVKLYILVETS